MKELIGTLLQGQRMTACTCALTLMRMGKEGEGAFVLVAFASHVLDGPPGGLIWLV